MRILVLGGSVFLGRHVVAAGLAKHHQVATFSRGLTQPGLFSAVEEIHGDRDSQLDRVLSREWDAVIDTCGFVPRIVRQSCEIRTQRYLFVSSVSVYADLSVPPSLDSPVHPAPDHEEVDRAYGGLKAACEEVVRGAYGRRATVVRPGLIAGPHDPTGRFTYWPLRIAAGGEILVPAPKSAPVQVIDVRDLASWVVHLCESDTAGTFHGVGSATTMGEFVENARAKINPDANLIWTDPKFLSGIAHWSELPLWLPDDHLGMVQIDNAASREAGLVCRPLVETAVDTLEWAATLDGDPLRQVDGRYAVRTLTRAEEARRLALAVHPPEEA